ncbi:MAG: MBL fold metallo-hydrolase [Deltaproteobacteria bacterium]|nr:MBL fold metallo-hydrolase [Deltaproteobacteria bacterium]
MVHIVPDCGFARSYIIEEENGLMVVDVGSIGAAQEIEAYCTQILNRPLRDIQFIIATHFHIDHIGGIGTLLKKCSPETKVMFHPLVQEYLDGTRELSPMKNWISGLLPTMMRSIAGVRKLSHVSFENAAGIPLSVFRDYRYLPYEDQISYFDSGRLPRYRIGFGNWEIIATPGHTEDSVSFYNEDTRELICGDLIIGGNDGTGDLNPFHYDPEVISYSYWRAYDLLPGVIYPGHGGIVRHALDAMRLPLTPGSTGMLSPFPYR